jgi:hypothetical protein
MKETTEKTMRVYQRAIDMCSTHSGEPKSPLLHKLSDILRDSLINLQKELINGRTTKKEKR